jgi:hypothetical protein
VPCGDWALNMLGLSTQVMASYIYYSDGPYKKYTYGKFVLEFRHRANRELTNLSYTTALVVQAFKALGREENYAPIVRQLSRQFPTKLKQKIIKEVQFVPDWIGEIIKKICV